MKKILLAIAICLSGTAADAQETENIVEEKASAWVEIGPPESAPVRRERVPVRAAAPVTARPARNNRQVAVPVTPPPPKKDDASFKKTNTQVGRFKKGGK